MNVDEMLKEMAQPFQTKIEKGYTFTVQVDIQDQNASWHVVTENGKVTVNNGPCDQPHFIFVTTTDVLHQIYHGKMAAFTAASKAKMSDTAPLDWKIPENVEITPEMLSKAYFFLRHFFNTSDPEKILLGEQYSRVVHGGHAIPLYYHPGFRSAWYLLKKGEQLNEPGDTNPFPQAVIFIEGTGIAKIKDKTISVKAGESYYIPPGADHVVWTESDQPLILIWLAWGEGA
ncbi:MAG: cupin domain-containing protein [Theionarchaea archaeon]|nr:cupin domain-containing protein [Theionarchaea archaeon]